MSDANRIPWPFVPVPDWALAIDGLSLGEAMVLGCIVGRYDFAEDRASIGMRSISDRIGARDRTRVRAWFRTLVRRGLVVDLGLGADGYTHVRLVVPGSRPAPAESPRPRSLTASSPGGAEPPPPGSLTDSSPRSLPAPGVESPSPRSQGGVSQPPQEIDHPSPRPGLAASRAHSPTHDDPDAWPGERAS